MFGILNLNKPVGPTSRDCVNQIERILKPVKVGHAGTLDPIASGVLLVLVGQAVRLTDAIHSLPKQYIGQFQLGATSDSSDTESAVTSLDNSPIIAQKQLLDSLSPFRGTIEQTPPKYSAVWIDGKRAHELARQGKTFEVPKRRVMVHSIELTSFEFPKFELTISCGTGTYVRSLGRDIARSLGSDAVMTRLVRTGIGPFSLSNAVDPESLTSKADIAAALLPAKLGVQHWPQTRPSESTLLKLEQGVRVDQSELNAVESMVGKDYAAAVDPEGRLRALLARTSGQLWRPDKCFLLSETMDH